MMLAFHGQQSELDLFDFHLARELGRTLTEIEAMSHHEYVAWRAYFTVEHTLKAMRPR